MAKNTQQNWGTQAILEGSIRDRGGTLIMELNNPPDTRNGLPLQIVLKKETGEVIFNGHPFGGTEALLSVLARKLYLMKQQARRETQPQQDPYPVGDERRQDPGETRICTYHRHEGDNPLPADEEHFSVRQSGDRKGQFVGWCRACQTLYAQSRAS